MLVLMLLISSASDLRGSIKFFFLDSQGVPEQKLRAHLGSFGVTGNLALQPMYTLSGDVCIACCHIL